MSVVNRGKWINLDQKYTARLVQEILSSITIDEESGCWIWVKSCQRNGCGQKRAFGEMMPAHRASWLAFRGSPAERMDIAHCCGNRKCVNPSHLKEITHAQNMRERSVAGNDGRREIVVDGVKYPSVAIAAKSLNLTRSSVRYRERKQLGVLA